MPSEALGPGLLHIQVPLGGAGLQRHPTHHLGTYLKNPFATPKPPSLPTPLLKRHHWLSGPHGSVKNSGRASPRLSQLGKGETALQTERGRMRGGLILSRDPSKVGCSWEGDPGHGGHLPGTTAGETWGLWAPGTGPVWSCALPPAAPATVPVRERQCGWRSGVQRGVLLRAEGKGGSGRGWGTHLRLPLQPGVPQAVRQQGPLRHCSMPEVVIVTEDLQQSREPELGFPPVSP